jgi:hypothetical protein
MLVSDKADCKMAACGHWQCAKCLHDYFHALGPHTTAKCPQCQSRAPKLEWRSCYALTGVSAEIQKLKPQQVVEPITTAEAWYLKEPPKFQ